MVGGKMRVSCRNAGPLYESDFTRVQISIYLRDGEFRLSKNEYLSSVRPVALARTFRISPGAGFGRPSSRERSPGTRVPTRPRASG